MAVTQEQRSHAHESAYRQIYVWAFENGGAFIKMSDNTIHLTLSHLFINTLDM